MTTEESYGLVKVCYGWRPDVILQFVFFLVSDLGVGLGRPHKETVTVEPSAYSFCLCLIDTSGHQMSSVHICMSRKQRCHPSPHPSFRSGSVFSSSVFWLDLGFGWLHRPAHRQHRHYAS